MLRGLPSNPLADEFGLNRADPARRQAMSDQRDVHKISDQHKRRAEHAEDELEKEGMGHDQAEKEAVRQAVAELGPGAGGRHAGADSPKHAGHVSDHRLGSDKTLHSGQP